MKAVRIFRDIVYVFALIILITAIMCFALKLKPAVVMSGSMEPTLPVGSVIVIDTEDAGNVKIGEPIAFYTGGAYVTHRIVDDTEQGFITKGDANDSVDPWVVDRNKVDGKVVFAIPYIGYIFKTISSRRGLLIAGSLFLCLVLSGFLDNKGKKQKAKHAK